MNRIEKINVLDWLIEDYKIEPRRLKDLYIECNTLDLDLESKLYRIINYDRLIESLKSQSLSMSKPVTWPDPFETFLMNYKAKMKDGTIVGFDPIKDTIYCQCWSLQKECEALWKVHSEKDFKAVKIKTTADRLMNYLYDINNQFHYLSYFIGNVSYVEEDFIIDLLKEGLGRYYEPGSTGMAIIQSLLIKRKAFEYENEVRLIFNAPNSDGIDFSKIANTWSLTDNYFLFKIDINDVIEEITFHPFLDEKHCIEMEKEIRALNYKGEIKHSKLFTKKEIIFDF
jgi:hypothetical protein